MSQLTNDLKDVAVYLDDILVSGATAKDHLQNLRSMLQRLQDKGLRCRLEKCIFAQPSVEYLGINCLNPAFLKAQQSDIVTTSDINLYFLLIDAVKNCAKLLERKRDLLLTATPVI